MAHRRTTSVSEDEPVYRVVRPKLHTPYLLRTDPFNSKITPNDLHWAAEKGNINLLAHLLLENHTTNITDAFGRTPLHEAAANNQLQAADWLMFHGADPHIKDYESHTAMSMSKSEKMTQILSQNPPSKRPETIILIKDTTHDVYALDVLVFTGNQFGPEPSYMTCRRRSPSKSSLRHKLAKGEHFWRDVIEYKMSQVNSSSVVTVNLLVADLPPSTNELILKIEGVGGHVKDVKPGMDKFFITDNEVWVCQVLVHLNKSGSIGLCSRPKSEVMSIPQDGGQVKSRTNSGVKLSVPPHAFKRPGNVLLTIEEVPEMEKEDTIISLSHFYNMEHSSCSRASEDIEMTLPIPSGYTGDGEVVVLSRPGSAISSEGEEEQEAEEAERWEVMEAKVEPDEGRVRFKTNNMGINAPVEVEKGANREDIRTQTANIYSKRKDCHVKFLVVGKVLGFNQFDIVVECLKPDQIYLRLDEWKKESYTRLRVSGDFPSKMNQKYRLELQGNLKCLYRLSDLHLELLPGQMSHQSLLVEIQNVSDAPNGSIAVHMVGHHGVSVVTQLPLLLGEQLEESSQAAREDNENTTRKVSGTNRPRVPDKGNVRSRIPRRIKSYPGENGTTVMDDNMERPFEIYETTDDLLPHDGKPHQPLNQQRMGLHSGLDVPDAMPGLSSNEGTAPIRQNKVNSNTRYAQRTGRFDHHVVYDRDQSRRPTDSRRSSFQSNANGRRLSNASGVSLPAGVGVTLGGAAASEDGDVQSVNEGYSGSEGVHGRITESRTSSLAQHMLSTAPASEDPESLPIEEGISAPVSNSFLASLVKVMSPDLLLFVQLGLHDREIQKIRKDTATTDIEYTMFVMLDKCREKRGDNAAFLHMLLLALEDFQQNDTKQWVVNRINRWLDTCPSGDQGFVRKVHSIARRFREA
ncbi:uncharacterized protein [Haliotis cracherodii]|uniref:uncharacterized protein n=1 Tax=Haliotis cracherodii TaxID=6455 RepID=UPI0039E93EFE